jgi:hypothetical protein
VAGPYEHNNEHLGCIKFELYREDLSKHNDDHDDANIIIIATTSITVATIATNSATTTTNNNGKRNIYGSVRTMLLPWRQICMFSLRPTWRDIFLFCRIFHFI